MNRQTFTRQLFDLKPESRHCRFQVLYYLRLSAGLDKIYAVFPATKGWYKRL
jgi:hypothetical protein